MYNSTPSWGEYTTQEVMDEPTVIELILTILTTIIFVVSVWSGLVQIQTRNPPRRGWNHNQNDVMVELRDHINYVTPETRWKDQSKLDMSCMEDEKEQMGM